MQTITAIQSFPNGTPIDSVQAKVTAVYERREIKGGQYGDTTVQKAQISDVAGNKMYIEAWGHPNLDKLKDMEVVIHAGGQGKGVKVKHNTYTPKGKTESKTDVMLEVSKVGQFQTVAVFNQNSAPTAPQAPVATKTPVTVQNSPKAPGLAGKPIHGATAGLATNQAITILLASGNFKLTTLEEDIVEIGGKIARAALRLEAGEIGINEKTVSAKREQVALKADPNSGEVNDKDLPF